MNKGQGSAPKPRTITDLHQLLTRLKPQHLSPTAWAEAAGVASAFRELKRKPGKSMTLQSLDLMAREAGADDFVALVSGTPRFDRDLLRKAVREVVHARDTVEQDLTPSECADLVIALMDYFTRQGAPFDPIDLRRQLDFAMTYRRETDAG